MPVISADDIIRCDVTLRTPFAVESLPLLSKVHEAAFRHRRRSSKRFVGKPAKRLFRAMIAAGAQGEGVAAVTLADGTRKPIRFNARNTQFGALYQPQNLPVYEPETSALLDRLVADDDVFFDIGANWGWYAMLVATRPGFRGAVHAFEPFPATLADLKSVVAQAGLDAVVACHGVALADREGEAEMGFSDGVQSGLARLGEGGGQTVPLSRLDALRLPQPQVIKVDAEDHELEVLRGAAETIAAARPFIVFENWLHADDPALTLAPIQLLAGQGYRFYCPGFEGGDPDCVLAKPTVTKRLVLLPFLPAQRFLMPSQLNIVAVPEERAAEFAARLYRGSK